MTRPRVSVFIAVSLDGYIATVDDSLDWLTDAADPSEDYGFEAFLAGIDLVAMGRGTYDFIEDVPELPYGNRPIHVFTSRSGPLREGFTPITFSPREAVSHWAETGIKNVYVDGGVVVSGFLGEGLVDELTLTVAPVLLGSGKKLFHRTGATSALTLSETRAFPSGMVQLRYVHIRSGVNGTNVPR